MRGILKVTHYDPKTKTQDCERRKNTKLEYFFSPFKKLLLFFCLKYILDEFFFHLQPTFLYFSNSSRRRDK